jgi:hypothetical protein
MVAYIARNKINGATRVVTSMCDWLISKGWEIERVATAEEFDIRDIQAEEFDRVNAISNDS